MLKRRFRKRNSLMLLQSSSRFSDIVQPDNTSLIVNRESDGDTDELPKEITSVLSEDELIGNADRESTSLMRSLTQKTQSTPLKSSRFDTDGNGKKRLPPASSLPCEKKVPRSGPPENGVPFFEKILKDCGATSLDAGSTYLLAEDQTVFSIKVNELLKGNKDLIDEFLQTFNEAMNESRCFEKLLSPTLTSDDCEVARGPVQDSMIRMLLNVDCLQVSLLETLIQKLSDLTLDSDSEENESTQQVSNVLRQMRFLNLKTSVIIAEKLFEIINIAPAQVKREIIFMLPEIVPHYEMDNVSMKLLEMLKHDNSLTNVIVDAMGNLSLDKAVLLGVRTKLFNRLDKCPEEFLPSIVQFVLSGCTHEDECAQVLNGLRLNLPFTAKHRQMKMGKRRADEDSYLKMTFEVLKYSAMGTKQMADAWLKTISSVTSSTDFRCLDLMMLVILHGNLRGKKNQIMTIIRNKIKLSILTEAVAVETFETLSSVASENFVALLEISSALIKSVQQTTADFGSSLFRQCFVHFHFYMEQCVINEILLHIGTGSWITANTALSALHKLRREHREKLTRHVASIMSLLNKLTDLDHEQTRILTDIISDLIICESADGANAGRQDEMLMFIRKQVASSSVDVSKKGIIAAVTYGKHSGKAAAGESAIESAGTLLACVAMGSPGSSDVKSAFFNDEFSTMLRAESSQLSQPFLNFWREKIERTIANNIFVRNIDIECDYFPMSLQHHMSTGIDSQRREMVFPVVDFVLASNSDRLLEVPLTVIPSALRLLWCCDKSLNPSWFSASVVMPEVTVFDAFESYSERKKQIIMDCLFLCYNYLIECVNAFSCHNLRNKALLRLSQLLIVRKYIGRFVNAVPGYVPPNCQYQVPVVKTARGKSEGASKRGKKRKADDSMNVSPSQNVILQASVVAAEHVQCHGNSENPEDPVPAFRNGFFRRLHVDCLYLLQTDLAVVDCYAVNDETPRALQSQTTLEMRTAEALFLLDDGIGKSRSLLNGSNNGFHWKGKWNFFPAEKAEREKFLDAAVTALPGLKKKMEVWSNYCKDLIRKNDGVLDGPGMYSKDSRLVKLALSTALKFIAEILSCPDIKKPINKSLLKVALSGLSEKRIAKVSDLEGVLMGEAASASARYLAQFCDGVLLLDGASSVVKAVRTCLDLSSSKDSNSFLADLCLKILRKPWLTLAGVPERGAAYNQHVDYLVKIYFSAVDDALNTLRNTANAVLKEMNHLTDKDAALNSFRCIHRTNFPILFRAMCDALVSSAANELNGNKRDEIRIHIWNDIIEILLILVNIVKMNSSRTNLAALLKRSHSVIQLFFTDGLPAVELGLRMNAVGVLKLLKALQTATRFLHSVCCHSKMTNDSLVASHVPAIRAQCERLTLEVKGMLISNKIPMECITIAILKNKDLEGNDILSQETKQDDSDDESELPIDNCEESSEDGNNTSPT